MKSVKSFRIDDILVGTNQSKKRKDDIDTNMVTVKATREEEIVKVDEDDDPTPSISPFLRRQLAEKRKEKKFGKRDKIEVGNTSTTSDDSGNSSRSSTPTDLSIKSMANKQTKASERPKSPVPSTSTATPSSSDEGNNSNHCKNGDAKSSKGQSETRQERMNNTLGNSPGVGTPIGNGVPLLGGSGFYPYANHPHFPIMFPLPAHGGASVSQEQKGYPSTSTYHFSAAASAPGAMLMDPFLSKARPFFGGPRHPSNALIGLGVPPPGLDFSMYSQHHPSFPGGFYGMPSMHEAVATQQKAHQQQLMNERPNYPTPMFQLNRPPSMFQLNGSNAAAVSAACKRKGGQIRFTTSQTAQLEKSFVQQKYLNASDRKKLAHSLGLSDRQVKTWFQNRRAKLRKCKGGICLESDVYPPSMKPSP